MFPLYFGHKTKHSMNESHDQKMMGPWTSVSKTSLEVVQRECQQ